MKRNTSRPREALGCFLMLVLAAIMCMGVLSIAMLAISQRQGADQPQWLRSILLWVGVPGAGLALVWWLTYRCKSSRTGDDRR